MPGPVAVRTAELDGRGIRRLTRQSAAQRAVTTWSARLGEAWSTVVSIGVGLALLGGWLASVRDAIAGRAPGSGTALPGAVTALTAAVVAVAGLTTLLDRLGPISASPAAAAWWLPLPADRRGLLRGDLGRLVGLCAGATALLCTPVAMASSAAPSLAGVATTVVGGASAAAVLVGALAVLQTRARGGILAPLTGAVAVTAALAAAVASIAPWAADAVGRLTRLPSLPWPAALGLTALAAVLLVAADRGLGQLPAGSLRAHGAASAFASASVFSLDTRDLGRALAVDTPRPRPWRRRRFALVRSPWQALATADLLLLARSRWQCGQIVVAIAVPVLAARTDGLDRLPAATAVGLLLGWLTAAVAVGHPARFAQANPALDRLLPLSAGQVVAARAAAPALVLTLVCGLSGLLVGLGSADPVAWAALALGAAPAWTAASLRGAYRPDLNWSGPVASTPMGVLPAGVGATLVQGVDVGLAGTLPILVAVLVGAAPSPALIGVQFLWAGCLAGGALTYLARRTRT